MMKLTEGDIKKLLKKNLEMILEDACAGAGLCVIRLISSDRKSLIAAAIHALKDGEIPQIDTKISINGTASEQAVIKKTIEIIAIIENDLRFEKQRAMGYKSAMIVPLSVNGNIFGVIQIYTKEKNHIFGDHEKHIAQTVADDLSYLFVIKKQMEENEKLQQKVVQQKSLEMLSHNILTFVHDARNIIGPIITFLRLIKKGDNNYNMDKFVEMTDIATQQINNLFEEVLAFGKPLIISKKPRAIIEVIDSTIHNLADINIVFGFSSLKTIHMDADKIGSVIRELLKNANDASPNSEIIIRTNDVNRGIILEVENHGEISPNNREKIFKPFFTTKGRNGTGLGLPYVLKVIEGHHGNLSLISENGKTIFKIFIPE